jgi:hypothetical protein
MPETPTQAAANLRGAVPLPTLLFVRARTRRHCLLDRLHVCFGRAFGLRDLNAEYRRDVMSVMLRHPQPMPAAHQSPTHRRIVGTVGLSISDVAHLRERSAPTNIRILNVANRFSGGLKNSRSWSIVSASSNRARSANCRVSTVNAREQSSMARSSPVLVESLSIADQFHLRRLISVRASSITMLSATAPPRPVFSLCSTAAAPSVTRGSRANRIHGSAKSAPTCAFCAAASEPLRPASVLKSMECDGSRARI